MLVSCGAAVFAVLYTQPPQTAVTRNLIKTSLALPASPQVLPQFGWPGPVMSLPAGPRPNCSSPDHRDLRPGKDGIRDAPVNAGRSPDYDSGGCVHQSEPA
jgi:hypothetical protein